MDSKMLSTMSIAAEKAGESPEPAPTASSAQQAPGRPGLPEIALYVHTAKDTHLPSMGPPSANSDVQSPHHMMTAVSTGSAFGSMMMLDPSRNFLQGFRCCNRTFDDLFQLLSHQAAGNCASDKMSVGDPESTVEPRGETSFATQSSQEGSSTMGSLSSFVAVDSVTPKVEAAEEFEPPIEAPQEQSAPDLQLQEHGHIPAATHVQHHVPAAHALPIAAPAIVSHPPMLLATLPDGRSVLVPVGPGGQIPTIAGTLPMPMAADGHGSYAHSPFSNHSSTGMSPLYEEDGREAGHHSPCAKSSCSSLPTTLGFHRTSIELSLPVDHPAEPGSPTAARAFWADSRLPIPPPFIHRG
ncbi:hypothetical protein DFJ74DRAFT_501794 [Hyaloraphidium curvatum]|nr:hypothetical protein DFJ74DRAFT_501794 [Hyaloraphidium curvatum]